MAFFYGIFRPLPALSLAKPTVFTVQSAIRAECHHRPPERFAFTAGQRDAAGRLYVAGKQPTGTLSLF